MCKIFIYNIVLILLMKNYYSHKDKNKRLIKILVIAAAIFVSAMFVGEAFQASLNTVGTPTPASSTTQATTPDNVFSTSGYTNGTYKVAEIGNINHLNIFEASTVCDFNLLDEIYDSPYNFFPNESLGPWLATGFSGTAVHNVTTVDPLTGAVCPVAYIYTVHIRPGVKWQDWTPANAKDTYEYPLVQTFTAESGKPVKVNNTLIYDTAVGHNITVAAKNLTMDTYYVQSADFILSWEIMSESEDFSSEYPDLINMVPVNNLTVEYYMSAPTSLFTETILDTDIIPYNVWSSHAYSSVPGLWNYSATLPSSGAYNDWDLGYNPATGYAPGLVGSGPFMMYGGFGMPKGAWISSDYWQLYINPDYFVQYVPSLAQYTPRVYSLYTAIYTSDSAAVASLADGQTYALLNALPPTFIPTVKSIPSSYIYDKAGTGFGYQQVNSYAGNAPFNITDLRLALEYAIPKTYLASVVAEGYLIPGPSTPVPDSDILWQASGVPYYHFDLANAESEIDAAINETATLPTSNQLSYSTPDSHTLYSPGATLYYGSKPVSITIQITVASEDPLGVEGADKIASYWNSLGISTSVKEESFSTLIANIVSLSPSDQTAYEAVDLGCSGWELNPADDLASWENSYLGAGTGVYKGTFTTFNYTNGPTLAVNLTNGDISTSASYISSHSSAFTANMTLIHDMTYKGKYVNNFLNKLVNESYVETNITAEHVILDVLQYVLADEGTFENLGYSVDPMAIVNSTFTGIVHDNLGLTSFWYWNFMSIHLKKPVVIVKPVALPYQLEVGVISNQQIYYSGQYGNLTIQVRDQYGQAMPNIPVSVGYVASEGGVINITSTTGTTNSNGIYHFEFKVLSSSTFVYTSDYGGDLQFTATALAPNSSYTSGIGKLNVNTEPYAVAYKIVKYPNYISTANDTSTKNTTMEVEIYNPVTGSPISGYKYSVETLSGLLKLIPTGTAETLTNLVNSGFMSTSTPGKFYYNTTDLGDGMLYLNGNLYIADMGTNNVTMYNLTTEHLTNITVGTNPMQLAYDSMNNTIYVTNIGSNNVTVINAKTNNVISNIAVGKAPIGIAYDMYNNTMYVTNSGSNTVSVINAGSYNVTTQVTVNGVMSTNKVELTGKVIKTIEVGNTPEGLIMGINNTIYVTNYGSHNVTAIKQMNSTVINITANINTYGANPAGMAMNSTDLFIANAGSDNITIVNMTKNMAVNNLTLENATGVPLLNEPMGLEYNKGELYATDTGANDVTVINITSAISDKNAMGITNTSKYTKIFQNIMVGTMPMNIAINSSKTELFAANYMSGNITEIDLTTNATVKSFNITGLNITDTLPVPDYNMTELSGTTGSNGMVYISMEYNSSFNWAINGITTGYADTYIFMGDYAAGAAMGGESPYMDLAELTSSINPNGFGVSQPFEIPVMVNETPMDNVHISVSYSKTTTYNGTEMITLNATMNGQPLSDYNITLTAQNTLGANRGIFIGTTGSAFNPNSYFGSTSIPEITVTTNANGMAYVNFTASEYTYTVNSTGVNVGYKVVPFSSTHLVPYDEFQLGIMGMNGTGAYQYVSAPYIVSTPFVFNNTTSPFIYPTATAYLFGASYSNGQYYILSDHSYTMYINSTYNTMAGPTYKNLPFTVSTNYGHLSVSKGNTGSAGSYKLTFTSKPVTKITKITVTITMTGSGQKEVYSFYVEPYKAPSYTLDYAIIGVVAAIAAIFIGLYAMEMRKLRKTVKK